MGLYPYSITLPDSKCQIHFTCDYDQVKVAEFTRALALDAVLAQQVRDNPVAALAKIGIIISEKDRKGITDQDVLIAMGHRAPVAPGGTELPEAAALPLVAVAVVVVVAVVNAPTPVY